jgi:TetR/AcrR family transcriptional repressor of nem operon
VVIATHSPTVETGTRAQILRVARDLIQTRSYLGFSFQDIADQVGIRKASLYHHFPTKEALAVEVLHEARRAFEEWSAGLRGTPQEQLAAYVQMFRKALRAGQAMCPGGSFAAGWDCIDDEVRSAVRELRGVQVVWLSGVLGGLRPPGTGGSLADAAASVFAVCQGGLTAARMTGHVADFEASLSALKGLYMP